MTATPEQGPQRTRNEDALERGQVFQDAEGRRTTDPGTAMEHADDEADRNAQRLEQGEVGPRVPDE